MIITQTPLRISLLGGGTDFAEHFEHHEGCVVSTTINKYIYVIVKARFDNKIRVGYTKTELVDDVGKVQHDLVRESLHLTGITRRIEIVTMADIPSEGSGLGSSSAVTVGLLNALHTYLGDQKGQLTLAREACNVEIDRLGHPIGYQDQYIAAYGGLRFIRFTSDGIFAEPLLVDSTTLRQLDQNLMLFYTNITRKADSILAEQVQNINARKGALTEICHLAHEAKGCLESGETDHIGELLNRNWELKKALASRISNPIINDLYQTALQAGAIGGKISGAGGGGFLTVYCPLERQNDLRSALHGFRELPFNLSQGGTKIVFQSTHC